MITLKKKGNYTLLFKEVEDGDIIYNVYQIYQGLLFIDEFISYDTSAYKQARKRFEEL